MNFLVNGLSESKSFNKFSMVNAFLSILNDNTFFKNSDNESILIF